MSPVGADSVLIEFPNSPVAAILPFYERLTGKRIIRDAKLEGTEISITSSEPLTKAEAVGFIESALLLNGYALVPVDARTLKVINYEAGKSPRSQGLPVVVSPEGLPEGEGIVNYVMTLDHVSPDDAARAFSQVVALNPYGAITPLNAASAVIITENTTVVRSLIQLKDHLDVPSSQVANEFLDLERADAEKIAEILTQLYVPVDAGVPAVPAAAVGPPQGAAEMSVPIVDGRAGVKVIAYRRTNSLLVIGRPVDLAYIRGLVESFDKPSDASNFLRRKLQYVSVVDYLPAFFNAIARNTDVEKRDDLLKPDELGDRAGDVEILEGGGGGTGGASGGFGGGIYPDRLSEPEPFTAPQSFVVGNTLMIADPQANSLIVSGSPEHVEIIEKLIDEVDVQPKQVYLSTIIGQMTLGDELQYSLNAFKRFDNFTPSGDDGGNLLGGGSFDTRGGSIVGALSPYRGVGAATGRGLSLLGSIIEGDNAPIDVVLRVLTRDQNFRLLSRPSVYAQNNSKAIILSGQRIAVPTSTLTSVGGGFGGNDFPGSISSNIEYLDVVLKLEVVPLINSDDEVTLRIAQVNDTVVGQQVISGNVVPTLNTQELVTTITVPNAQTIVLGGLITERADDDRTGVPVIRRIPVLKSVVGSTDRVHRREELLIFIQPFIIDGKKIPSSPNEVEVGRSGSTIDTMKFGDPFISEQLTPVSGRNAAPSPGGQPMRGRHQVISVSGPAEDAPAPQVKSPAAGVRTKFGNRGMGR
ncbi:MAG: Type II secretory pathway component GspD/PulD [Verrucomicrobia bacterium]|nr:MAG: Type II secretory pathway component GspD/PulD [Verrucomicrobiota bacterium]